MTVNSMFLYFAILLQLYIYLCSKMTTADQHPQIRHRKIQVVKELTF
jgi:hypothetical protein